MLKYFLRALFTNKALWGWAVLFMGFWLFLGSYVFGSSGISGKTGWDIDTGVWFSIIGLLSASVIATPVSYTAYYASPALTYGIRYTKLKPSRYLFNLLFSTAIVTIIVGAVIMIMTVILFSSRSGFLMIPSAAWTALGVFFLSGVFFFLLSISLVLFVNNHLGLRNMTLVAFFPQILSYIFGLSQVGVQLPSDLVYAAPFSDIPRLLYLAWLGKPSYLNIANSTGGYVNSYLLLISLLIWILVLFITSFILLKKIRSTFVESAREI